jgi:hypothetical protein
MSIFASLLEMNNSLAQTKMSPYNSYQENWNEDCVTQEKHIDEDNEGAAWINNAKDRTQSIISNLDSQGTIFRYGYDAGYQLTHL